MQQKKKKKKKTKRKRNVCHCQKRTDDSARDDAKVPDLKKRRVSVSKRQFAYSKNNSWCTFLYDEKNFL